jgi:hypothetical protein
MLISGFSYLWVFKIVKKLLGIPLFFVLGLAQMNQIQGEQIPKLLFIANVENGQQIAEFEVGAILTGAQTSWHNGSSIKLVLPGRKADIYEQVGYQIFQESGMMMQRHWLKLVFSGRGYPPKYADNELDMIKYVKNMPGSAAVISAENRNAVNELFVKEL